jgi:pimeloyl-ACP methyl ester carboxylesterase
MGVIKDRVICGECEMEYIRFGSGKKTLVIIPGLSVQSVLTSADAIEKRYELFEEDYTVYLFDRRLNISKSYTVSDMAEDTACAMGKLGIKDCCLFGTSQGGMIAMLIAAKHPELVSKLALGSTAARMNGDKAETVEKWSALAKAGDAEGLYLSFGETVYPKAVFAQYKAVLSMMARTVTPEELERFVTISEGTRGYDSTEIIRDIQCPVLAIGDSEDAVLGVEGTLEIGEILKDKPDFEMYIYNGFGHAAYDTAPDYPQRLLSFFSQI